MAKKEGPHYRFRRLEFYANQGMITLIDLDKAADSDVPPDEAIHRLRPGQFMERALAIRMGVQEEYPDEAHQARKLLEDAMAACKLAKAQGDFGDKKVQEHHAKHTKRSRILLSGGSAMSTGEANKILGPVGGEYKIRQRSDPRDTLLKGANVVPDITIDGSKMLTPKRTPGVKKSRKNR